MNASAIRNPLVSGSNGRRNAHTRSCYQRDVARLRTTCDTRLNQITLGDLQRLAKSLIESGLAPISQLRTLAAIRSLFGFCQRMRYLPGEMFKGIELKRLERQSLIIDGELLMTCSPGQVFSKRYLGIDLAEV